MNYEINQFSNIKNNEENIKKKIKKNIWKKIRPINSKVIEEKIVIENKEIKQAFEDVSNYMVDDKNFQMEKNKNTLKSKKIMYIYWWKIIIKKKTI